MIFGVIGDFNMFKCFQILDRSPPPAGRISFEDFFFNCSKAFSPDVVGPEPVTHEHLPLPGPLGQSHYDHIQKQMEVASMTFDENGHPVDFSDAEDREEKSTRSNGLMGQ